MYHVDPTKDGRWSDFVEKHPKASVFHTMGWLEALRSAYGYEPVVFTTSSPSRSLNNGLVLCRVNSFFTGHRLVSLPFSDHCEPLCDSPDDLDLLVRDLQKTLQEQGLQYLELRPIDGKFARITERNGFRPGATFYLHVLDLCQELDELFAGLDKDSVQRRIQRAERACLTEKCGTSDYLLKEFYRLFVKTRGRHHLPPTPYIWFLNLIEYFGKALEIRLASLDGAPIAAILTLRHKCTVYYKYGCSNAQFHKFGAMPWLLWRAIVSAKMNGANEFDMGRTEEQNAGLLAFKNHWVPQARRLVYWRYPKDSSSISVGGWKLEIAKRVFSTMPDSLRAIAGRITYRHIG